MTTPKEQAEETLRRLEAEALSLDLAGHASTDFCLEERATVRTVNGLAQLGAGRQLWVEQGRFYGDGLRYRRFLDLGWLNVPEWAVATILRSEALMMLEAYYAARVEAVPA